MARWLKVATFHKVLKENKNSYRTFWKLATFSHLATF